MLIGWVLLLATAEANSIGGPIPLADIRASLLKTYDNLWAYYSFNHHAMDSSGNDRHGSMAGGPSFDPGVLNAGLTFENPLDQRHEFVTLPPLSASNWTVMLWAKWSPSSHGENASIYSFGDDASPPDFPNSQIFFTLWAFPNGDFRAGYKDSFNTSVNSETASLADGDWHHIAVAVSDDRMRTFFDGQRLSSDPIPFFNTISNAPHYVGYHQWYGGLSGASRFSGSVDELLIFDSALSDTEIIELYRSHIDTDGDGLFDDWENRAARFQFVSTDLVWTEASFDANRRGGHLATITSAQEWMAVMEKFPSLPLGTWLGGYQFIAGPEPNGSWSWVTGEPWSYTQWNPGEPNEIPGGSDYLQIWSASQNEQRLWNDIPNDAEGWPIPGYLLEYGYPTDPADSDTDQDGVDDGTEFFYRTHPLNANSVPPVHNTDSDRDGLTDVFEDGAGRFQFVAGEFLVDRGPCRCSGTRRPFGHFYHPA